MLNQGKWPRQYAAEILELKTRKERRDALSQCPEHLQSAIAKHVEIAFALKNQKK